MYLPIEMFHLYDHTTWINALVMLFNLGVVMYMIFHLKERRKIALCSVSTQLGQCQSK